MLKYETVNAEKQKKNKWTNSAGQEELPDEIREIPWKKEMCIRDSYYDDALSSTIHFK